MSIRVRAFLYTVGIFAAGSVAGIAIAEILRMIPEAYYFPIFIAVTLIVAFNLVYSVITAHMEYRAKLEKIATKSNT